MARETNKMRIKLDFVVEFTEPIDNLPMGEDTDIKLLYDYLTIALRKRKLNGADRIMPHGKASFSLDFRTPKKGQPE